MELMQSSRCSGIVQFLWSSLFNQSPFALNKTLFELALGIKFVEGLETKSFSHDRI